MTDYLYSKVCRVPEITDTEIAEMRHIEPLLRVADSVMYRRMKDADKIDARNVSFSWDATPIGGEFTFDTLNSTTVITQHNSSIFFRPSLAEVYAWIRFYLGDQWRSVSHFCMGECRRLPGSTDVACDCVLMGGPILVAGGRVVFPSGAIGYKLVEKAGQQ